MKKCANTDVKWAAITVHITGPAVDYSSKKKGPIMIFAAVPHQVKSVEESIAVRYTTSKFCQSQISSYRYSDHHFFKYRSHLSTKFSMANVRPFPLGKGIPKWKIILQYNRYVEVLEHVWFCMCSIYGQFCSLYPMVRPFDEKQHIKFLNLIFGSSTSYAIISDSTEEGFVLLPGTKDNTPMI